MARKTGGMPQWSTKRFVRNRAGGYACPPGWIPDTRVAGVSAKYNTRRNVYAAHRSQEWEERKEKTKEGAWEQRKKEWLEQKREEDTKEYEYDGMGFSDFHLSHEKTVRDEAMKNNWQKKQEWKADEGKPGEEEAQNTDARFRVLARCATPGCSRFRQYSNGCVLDRCCKQCFATDGVAHDQECIPAVESPREIGIQNLRTRIHDNAHRAADLMKLAYEAMTRKAAKRSDTKTVPPPLPLSSDEYDSQRHDGTKEEYDAQRRKRRKSGKREEEGKSKRKGKATRKRDSQRHDGTHEERKKRRWHKKRRRAPQPMAQDVQCSCPCTSCERRCAKAYGHRGYHLCCAHSGTWVSPKGGEEEEEENDGPEKHPEQGGDALRVTPSEESRRLRMTTQMRWMTSAARRSLERKEAEELEHIQIASLTETEKRLSGDRGPQDWRRAPVTRKRNRKPTRPFAEPCHRRILNPDGGKLVEEKEKEDTEEAELQNQREEEAEQKAAKEPG